MSEKYFIGLDSGTQSTRAILFDSKGNRVAKGAAEHPKTIVPQPSWCEHGKSDLGDAARKALAEMFAGFKGNKADIAAVGITTQRCVFITLDKNDQMLCNPISWLDNRWYMNFQSIGEPKTSVQNPVFSKFLVYYSKANWFKHNAPDIFEKAAKYMSVSSYLGYRLSGSFCDSFANGLGWPYDIINWTDSGDAEYELLGMRREQVARPVVAGTVIGKVTARAAGEFGIPEGTPVVMGTGDKQSELLSAGAINHGQAYITLGTLSGLNVVCKDFKPSPDFSYMTYLSAVPKIYNYEVALNKGFWLVSWFRDNFGGGLKAEAEAKGTSIEAMLDKEGEAVPPGADGLVVLPDWSPVTARPNTKGIFLGFDDRHGRAHLFRALIEGIVTQIKIGSDSECATLGMNIDELYVGGGGSKSNLAVQIIADIFGVPVHRIKESENCSLGAAMCGAVGAGVYADFPQAVKEMGNKFDTFQPKQENHAFYEAQQGNVVQKLYPALADVLKSLAELNAPKG
jgi:sugar (pentulose or hexulose) kinase